MTDRRIRYGGEAVPVKQELVAYEGILAWPKVWKACACPIVDHVDDHLRYELWSPEGYLLLPAEWPLKTPRSKVYASDWNDSLCNSRICRVNVRPRRRGF